MHDLLALLATLANADDAVAAAAKLPDQTPVYRQSVAKLDNGSVLLMARDDTSKFLVQIAGDKSRFSADFEGEPLPVEGFAARKIALNHHNALILRQELSWTAPVSLRQRRTTIGFGDRLGLATAGHLRAAKGYQLAPVLAQQSIRELTLTGRDYPTVVDDASFLVFQEGYRDGYGADGDHLKTIKDINVALDAGMPMITLDLTEVLHPEAEKFTAAEIDEAFGKLDSGFRQRVLSTYAGKSFSFADETISFDELEAKRCAVMYVDALAFTPEVYQHLKRRRGDAFDLELSIDETSAPTLPAHHLFIISELVDRGVVLNSLAPRFIGEFQKGIDYIGDLGVFEKQFAIHCKISQAYGNYKISVHSGSDKFSAFPIVGRHTEQRLHLKTAGTSWLEAVRVLTVKEPKLYRDLHKAAFEGLPQALKLYHITADFSKIPDVDSLSDAQLPDLMEMIEARQLIHITYGYLLNHQDIRPRFFAAMHLHEETYYAFLEKHFRRHFDTLGIPRD